MLSNFRSHSQAPFKIAWSTLWIAFAKFGDDPNKATTFAKFSEGDKGSQAIWGDTSEIKIDFSNTSNNSPVAKVWNKQESKESLRRGRGLSEAQIVDSSDDVKTEMKFFSGISVSRAQYFEFFELSENVLDQNSFGRKCCIMSFVLRSKRRRRLWGKTVFWWSFCSPW